VFEVRVAPGPGVPDGLVISANELVERYSHASGPGGQGVNTADSRVQLSLDLATTNAFTDVQRARALRNLATRLDGTVLTIDAAQYLSLIHI
jgi:ribosome-associated protein